MCRFHRYQMSRGITLLEMIIVMVVLVFVAGLAISSVQRSFSAQRVKRAADLVRAELNRARIQAVRTGDVHGFFYYPQSRNFVIAPFNEQTVRVMQDANRRSSRPQVSNFEYGDHQLPRGVVFADGEVTQDSRSESFFQENRAAIAAVRPVLFYPDGSSQTAQLYLRSEENDVVAVKLRGMTGTSTAAPVLDTRSNTR